MISLSGRPDPGLSNAATTGSLRDPGGPRAGSTAPPSFAELRNPTLTNSKITYDTNTTASLPLLVRPWSEGYEKGFHQGSLLFVATGDCNAQMCTAADLPTLNYLLENAHFKSETRRLGDGKLTPKTEREFLQKYNYFGVMRNDMMANSMLQKLFNCDVYGRSMVANIFGKLKRGDHVGLALLNCGDNTRNYQMIPTPSGGLLPRALQEAPSGVLQVCGTVNGKPSVLQGEVKHHIPLGVVSHAVAKLPSDAFISRALRETDQFTLLPRIEILII